MSALNDSASELLREAGACLRAAFPGQVLDAEQQPALFVAVEPIGVRVGVESLGQSTAMLELLAWIGRGIDPGPELGLYLAQRSADLPLGSLCIDAQGTIFLQHALLAESVRDTVLERLVRWLAHAAETVDRELRERFAQ